MAVFRKVAHGTNFAVLSQEDFDAIVAHEAQEAKAASRKAAPVAHNADEKHQAELAQRKAAPATEPVSTKASGPRAKPEGPATVAFQEVKPTEPTSFFVGAQAKAPAGKLDPFQEVIREKPED